MNLFERSVTRGEFQLGSGVVKTPAAWSGEAVIGIRPEDISFAEDGIPASVQWVEHLGSQFLVGVRADDSPLPVIGSRRPETGTVHLKVEGEKVHVFEKGSGANVSVLCRGSSVRV
jgi:multiple sugar transport system ATP-binding protein